MRDFPGFCGFCGFPCGLRLPGLLWVLIWSFLGS